MTKRSTSRSARRVSAFWQSSPFFTVCTIAGCWQTACTWAWAAYCHLSVMIRLKYAKLFEVSYQSPREECKNKMKTFILRVLKCRGGDFESSRPFI